MSFEHWIAVAGGLLLIFGLASTYVRRLPLSSALLYLVVGLILGPLGFGVLELDFHTAHPWFENVAEGAVVVSLFIGGLRMRLPPRHRAWRAAYWMAGPVMLISIAGLAGYASGQLGLGMASALLLGAVLAPTDPVLASAVSVNHAADHDRLKYALSGEAGLNDGAAFPFVVLALEWALHDGVGPWLLRWGVLKLLWASVVGLGVGYVLGHRIGRLAIRLRHHHRESEAPNDLLALALMALSFAAAEALGGWGFLAAFAAGVGVRNAEVKVVRATPHPAFRDRVEEPAHKTRHPPAEHLVPPYVDAELLEQEAVAAGVVVSQTLSFGDTAERLLEMVLVVLVGVAVSEHWDMRGVPLSLFLFLVLRPLAARLVLARTDTTPGQRWIIGLFGVRGIGTLYYLAHVVKVGFADANELHSVVDLAVTVVACSVVLHGIAATPVLRRYERNAAKARATASAPGSAVPSSAASGT